MQFVQFCLRHWAHLLAVTFLISAPFSYLQALLYLQISDIISVGKVSDYTGLLVLLGALLFQPILVSVVGGWMISGTHSTIADILQRGNSSESVSAVSRAIVVVSEVGPSVLAKMAFIPIAVIIQLSVLIVDVQLFLNALIVVLLPIIASGLIGRQKIMIARSVVDALKNRSKAFSSWAHGKDDFPILTFDQELKARNLDTIFDELNNVVPTVSLVIGTVAIGIFTGVGTEALVLQFFVSKIILESVVSFTSSLGEFARLLRYFDLAKHSFINEGKNIV